MKMTWEFPCVVEMCRVSVSDKLEGRLSQVKLQSKNNIITQYVITTVLLMPLSLLHFLFIQGN